MFDLFVRIGLFISLIFFWPSRISGDELFSLGALTALIVLGLFTPAKRQVKIGLPAALFVWAYATMFLNMKQPIQMSVSNLFVGFLAFKTMAERIDTDARPLGKLLFFFCGLSIVLIGMQHAKLDRWYSPFFDNEIAGFSFRPWILGCSAVMALPFLYDESPWATLILIPLLIVGHSTICVAAALVGFLICLDRDFPNLVRRLTVVAGLLVTVYIFYDNGIEWTRFVVWAKTLPYLKNPAIGMGFGAWAHEGFMRMNGTDPYHWRWAHNEFYQYFFEQGYVGLTLLLSWLFVLFVRNKSHIARAALVSTALISFFHPVYHWGKLSYLGIFILAFVEAGRIKDTPNQARPAADFQVSAGVQSLPSESACCLS